MIDSAGRMTCRTIHHQFSLLSLHVPGYLIANRCGHNIIQWLDDVTAIGNISAGVAATRAESLAELARSVLEILIITGVSSRIPNDVTVRTNAVVGAGGRTENLATAVGIEIKVLQ